MANRYHISDDGTPGVCKAASIASCPKTRAGDNFHGNLNEAQAESERRFEAGYGAVVNSTIQSNSKTWSKASAALSKKGVMLYRASPANDFAKTELVVAAMMADGLAAIHGVEASAVRRSGVDYIVEEPGGVRRVYGDEGKGLSYLGTLHPSLDGTVEFASESKFMLNGREAKYSEIGRAGVEYYSYATANVRNHGVVEFTVDKNGYPTAENVWESLDNSKVPSELFTDESLRSAIVNRGVVR